jgi:hypothetical protein
LRNVQDAEKCCIVGLILFTPIYVIARVEIVKRVIESIFSNRIIFLELFSLKGFIFVRLNQIMRVMGDLLIGNCEMKGGI